MSPDLTLNDGTRDIVFVGTKMLPDGRERINDETTLLDPERLILRHTVGGGGRDNPKDTKVDRHLIQLSTSLIDVDTEETYTAVTNVTFALPRTSHFTYESAQRQWALISSAIASRIEAICRGEA